MGFLMYASLDSLWTVRPLSMTHDSLFAKCFEYFFVGFQEALPFVCGFNSFLFSSQIVKILLSRFVPHLVGVDDLIVSPTKPKMKEFSETK
jgi:hypothetical protein